VSPPAELVRRLLVVGVALATVVAMAFVSRPAPADATDHDVEIGATAR
jgi:hypothetical protein